MAAQPTDSAAARAQIRGWIQRVGRSPREPYRASADGLQQHSCTLAASIHNSTSTAQRKVASRKLRAWSADLRIVAIEAAE